MTTPQSTPTAATAGADAPTALLQCLRMAVGSEILSVPIEAVREILEYGRLTPLPRTPAFVRGVMNLRGAVVPVIDLAARLGGPATQIGRRTCIVVVETSGPAASDEIAASNDAIDDDAQSAEILVVGLLVDGVYEVFDAAAGRVEPVPPLGTRVPAPYLAGMVRAHGQVIGLLALDRALAARELAQLIGAGVPVTQH
ncbi:MAG: chemotaxis protein CheW [Aquabacterium sp.]